jgi:hypothetical protein
LFFVISVVKPVWQVGIFGDRNSIDFAAGNAESAEIGESFVTAQRRERAYFF